MNQQTNEPIQSSSKNIWAITVIAVVITALAVGGGVFIWIKSSKELAQKESQTQINNLKRQIKQEQGANKKLQKASNHQNGISIKEATLFYPAPPDRNLKATRIDSREVKIEWTIEGGHKVYHIFRACGYSDEPSVERLIGAVSGDEGQYIDKNATPEKCFYTLTSFNIWGNESSKSSYVSVNKVQDN